MTRVAFVLLVAAIAALRGLELVLAARHTRRRRAAGACEAGAAHYPVMVLLHATFLVAAPIEVVLLDRTFVAPLAGACLLLLVLAMALRYWAIATLGERWTTRVLVRADEPLVAAGPYRWLRHPNYLAVVVELFALPMVHTAFWTATVYSLANAALLAWRMGVEERALLAAHCPQPAPEHG